MSYFDDNEDQITGLDFFDRYDRSSKRFRRTEPWWEQTAPDELTFDLS